MRRKKHENDAWYDIGAHHVFSLRFLNLGAKDLSQKPIREENQKLLPDENYDGLGTQRESCANKKMALFFRRFWVKEPRHPEKDFRRKVIASIVARAENNVLY